MKKFEVKEGTHVVLKISDIYGALTEKEQEKFFEFVNKVADHRELCEKEKYPKYYVVNVDESYSDLVLEVIKYGER